MVLRIQLHRSENVPWGFRLSGGSDFEIPLTVTKVTEGSVAEAHGLKVGDVVVEINNVSIVNLSHQMAHELIIGFTDTFVVGIQREHEEEYAGSSDFNAYPTNVERPGSEMFSEISEATANSTIDSISGELEGPKITEDQIAEIISGESEVLKDHNVIGVNFQKIIPKANIFKSSEVFKHLNEEAMKTKAEKDKEVKRWTTFLQKPNRPVPKPKGEADKANQEPYRIKIEKQPKPKCDPNRPPSPPRPVIVIEPAADPDFPPSIEPPVEEEIAAAEPAIDISDITDDDVPDLEECGVHDELAENVGTVNVNNDAQNGEATEATDENDKIGECENGSHQPENDPEEILSVSDSALERQLADVQKQLEALSHLPSTIQATLEAVTKQIAEIIPAFKIRTSVDITGSLNGDSSVDFHEDFDVEKEVSTQNLTKTETEKITAKEDVVNKDETIIEVSHATLNVSTNGLEEQRKRSPTPNKPRSNELTNDDLAQITEEQITRLKVEQVFLEEEEKWLREREKAQKPTLTLEEQQQLLAEDLNKNLKSTKLQNGPRTPQERPLVLPGGRKWRNPKDAYNEEFIAEILSSQAELISGSALGKYESPLLGYDDRINFLKYKKPEKDLSNLTRSEVFKLIHSPDDRPATGISERPPKVMAADDFI